WPVLLKPMEKASRMPVVGDQRRHATGRGRGFALNPLHRLPAPANSLVVVGRNAQPDALIAEGRDLPPGGAHDFVVIDGYPVQCRAEQRMSAAGGGEMLPGKALDGAMVEERRQHDAPDALIVENGAQPPGRHARSVE